MLNSVLGHGRLIFSMADFWRALCEQSVGREKEKQIWADGIFF